MFSYPEFDGEGKKILSVKDSDMMMDIAVYKMKKGDEKTFILKDDELAVMLVLGGVTFKFDGETHTAKRDSLFKCGPSTVHVSKGVSVTESNLVTQSVFVSHPAQLMVINIKFHAPISVNIKLTSKSF